ncbi:matrixin [Aquimarina sp. MAR_2010_214]|uniref:matrixin family metalloprotease n=1 Tax=Aquimarina sp. MAR_2010_214 TaxID=1250026 RepID=UPI000CAA1923|nr:matrixin family metalloprotease [Aquimarina sp. MAR_2010_214]PKV49395.1 matrixin [Aquimarina sp. MAR_2010_214]
MTKITKPTFNSSIVNSILQIENFFYNVFLKTSFNINKNGFEGTFKKVCQRFLFIISIPFLLSCSAGDDLNSVDVEPEFVALEKIIKVNIIYVESSETSNKSSYTLNEAEFINYLNGEYFHRFGIGLELGESKSLINEELYDLRDNAGSEPSTFLMQSRESYDKSKVNIYIVKRCNILGIAGIGRDQRVLMTDENLFTSTAPHEIGHALGLFHSHESENIMNTINKDSRHNFNKDQEKKIKKRIDEINLNN